ncbi:MAG: family 1 encapsulin nanocompartment shell protein [Bacteroidales bacterium]
MTQYHEPENELKKKTRDITRALTSLKEEIEAIDWYNQRTDVTENDELSSVLAHNRDEEIEHACMTIEWLRRNMAGWDRNLKDYIFKEAGITSIEENENNVTELGDNEPGEIKSIKINTMDLLKKNLAPITDKAWGEINEQSEAIFRSALSVRKFADVDGPHGISMGAVPLGRTAIPKNQETKEILYGIQEVLPLVEVRSAFNLNLWELDNADRGAKDINLDALVKAARRMAAFEEKAIYNGLKEANIKGMINSSGHRTMEFPKDPSKILHSVTEAVTKLNTAAVEGPYSMVLDTEKWEKISSYVNGYPLRLQLQQLLGGSLILAENLKGAMLVSERGGDFRLTLGQDISIGYETHNRNEVLLYFTEAFTFQLLEPAAIIYMK